MTSKFLTILFVFGLTAGVEMPRIIKKKQWREFVIYTMFLIFGLVIITMKEIFKINLAAISDWLVKAVS